ncbi:uncharacterized protein EI97DRAFT_382156, partial [Westerdykella ornata]
VSWIGTVIATLCVMGRLFTRFRVFRRLLIDDYLVIVALASSFAYAVKWHIQSAGLWTAIAQQNGKLPLDQTYFGNLRIYIRSQTGALICQGIGLWCIKLSFLLFFKTLGNQLKAQRVLWWTVTIFVLLMFPVYMSMPPWQCHRGLNNLTDLIARCNTQKVSNFTMNGLRVITIIDILTDVAILVIPFTILWQVRLSMRRKLALGSLFAITLFVILCAILRMTVVEHSAINGQMDVTWLYLWYKIELDTAIVVASLASFRALFTSGSSRLQYSSEPNRNFVRTPWGSSSNCTVKSTSQNTIVMRTDFIALETRSGEPTV